MLPLSATIAFFGVLVAGFAFDLVAAVRDARR